MKHTARFLSLFLLFLMAATSCVAQADKTSKKPFNLAGTVGIDGKTFVADHGSRVWKIANPDLLASIVGQHVTLKALKSTVTDEIVVSVVRLQQATTARLQDSAFRR